MKKFILSIRIVFYFMIREKSFNEFLAKVYPIDELDLLKGKLKRISMLVICFTLPFVFACDRNGLLEPISSALGAEASWVYYIVLVVFAIVTVLIVTTVVLTVYVFYFISKQENNSL